MPWKKGQSGNPAGVDAKQARMRRMLEDLTPRAINRLAVLLDSENEAVALAAVKEVLDRVWGRPRQQTQVDVRAEGHVAHHQVLLELAEAAKARATTHPTDTAAICRH
jgi:hypothetical protein